MNSKKDLYIKKFKKEFRHKKKIRFEDFKFFYNKHLDSVSDSLVRVKIQQLMKMDVIKRISWGIYSLNKSRYLDVNNRGYYVITMDIIDSKKYDSAKFNKDLLEKIDSINNNLKEFLNLDRKFHISNGDELQIIFSVNYNLTYVLLITLFLLLPYKVRYGISYGEVDEELEINSWDMNNKIFWKARESLEEIKNSKEYSGFFNFKNNLYKDIINNLLQHINLNFSSWSNKQWEAVYLKIKYNKTKIIAKKLDISEVAVNKRLRLTNYKLMLNSLNLISKWIRKMLEEEE